MSESALAYGGIGGSFTTVRFTLPASELVDGENTFTFEHVDARGVSIGYRILAFNVRDAEGRDLLAADAFFHDDPARWSADADEEIVAEGRRLWYARDSLYDSFVDGLDGDVGGGALDGHITASCSDCHAENGRDLAYFNYSDRSIVERARFHGLALEEGQQIAAYIRSLGLPIASNARPWNPPYQPGPGLDARPVYEWAGGAGLDAVLETDADMEPYLFPQGTMPEAVAAVVDRFAQLNMRELPVALQLPDWNQWLPAVHPLDAFDQTNPAMTTDDRGNLTERAYPEVLYEAALLDSSPESLGQLERRLQGWLGRGGTCYSQNVSSGPGWRALNSDVSAAVTLGAGIPLDIDAEQCAALRDDPSVTRALELAKSSLFSWMMTKTWEILHGNDLESRSATLTEPVCAGDTCVDASEVRGWWTNGEEKSSNVFSRAPHFVGYNAEHFTHQQLVVGVYDSTVWYHLQLAINPGYRRTAPSHFPYTMSNVRKLQAQSGISQSFRFWAGMIKQRQTQTNGRYGVEAGLDLRTAQPHVYYSDERGDTALAAGVGPELWPRLVDAFLVDLVEDAFFATREDWAAANQNRVVEQPDSTDITACDSCFESTRRPHPFEGGGHQGRNTFRVIPRFREIGVSEVALDRLLEWSEWMWPNGDWDSLRQ